MRKLSSKKPIRTSHGGSMFSLNEEAKRICVALMTQGDTYFDEIGWTKEQRREFLEKRGVQIELERLRQLITDHAAIKDRTTFFASIEMQKMVPAALNILARRLKGEPIIASDGRVIELPSDEQYDAAKEVLNRVGVGKEPSEGELKAPLVNIDNRTINMLADGDGSGSFDASASRERVRHVLSAFFHNLSNAGGKRPVKKKLGLPVRPVVEDDGESTSQPDPE